MTRSFGWLNLSAKVTLVALLLLGVAAPDWPQFHGKAMLARALSFPLAALLVPVLWAVRGRPRPYPHLLDFLVVLPFIVDSGGNAVNLYNTTTVFDRIAHWFNWAVLTTGFGLLMSSLPLARWNVFALAVGFGATTHIAWEVIEYGLMQLGSSGLQLTYGDTIDDLVLSLVGSLTGAILVCTVLWRSTLVPVGLLGSPETPLPPFER
jgi:hypothetical protein